MYMSLIIIIIIIIIRLPILYMSLCIHRKCIPLEGYLAQGRNSFIRRDIIHTLLDKLGTVVTNLLQATLRVTPHLTT